MAHKRAFIVAIQLVTILALGAACAPLPDVSTIIDETPAARKPRQLVSSKGVLSAEKSKVIMERLKRSVDPTDVLERLSVVVESVTDSPLTKGNKVTLLSDGPAAYAAMFRVIRHAKNHIHLESFIIEGDKTGTEFADLLLMKRREGVQVQLMYDSVGSINTPGAFFQRLKSGGIEVVAFNPINPLARNGWGLTHRDHRKILIVDGKVAIIGGINISKVYSSVPLKKLRHLEKGAIHWRDTDIQIEGPAVAELQKLFLDTWFKQTKAKPSGGEYFPQLKEEGRALVRVVGSIPGETNRIPFIMYVAAMAFAEHSIHLTNSYFIPDDQIAGALIAAAQRGVDVKIILPGVSDSRLALSAQRHHYSELLKSGVKIYEHSTSFLHAKTAVVDQVWSTVGSTNMDFLSLLNNDEVNAVILSREFAVEMEQMFANDLAGSREIKLGEWEKRGFPSKAREWFGNVFSRWL